MSTGISSHESTPPQTAVLIRILFSRVRSTMPRLFRRLLPALVLIGIAGSVLYVKALRPLAVLEYQAQPTDLLIEVMGTGTLEARISTIVSPKIQGRLVELMVDQGSHVVAGRVIARLDDSDLRRRVELAEANVEIARAGLVRLEAEVQRAEAVIQNARRDDERTRAAYDRGAATETERDRSTERVAIAQAELATAMAGVAEGRKALIAAQKNLEYEQARLDDTIIKAPFDGLIVRRDRDPGDIVLPGSSIYLLIALDEIWVSAWVDETSIASIEPGQSARVIIRSEPSRPYPGQVVRIGRETDRETRELVVDVALKTLPERWAIGQRAEVYIESQRLEGVIAVPVAAVSIRDGRQGVFVNRNGKARWVECELGLRSVDRVEIRKGVNDGDTVIWIAESEDRAALGNGRRVIGS